MRPIEYSKIGFDTTAVRNVKTKTPMNPTMNRKRSMNEQTDMKFSTILPKQKISFHSSESKDSVIN